MFRILTVLLICTCLVGCEEETYYPKPHGHFRIGFPDSIEMRTYEGNCNYSYQYPFFALVQDKPNCNQDIFFPYYNAVLHVTSLKFDGSKQNNLFYHTEYSRKLAYEHRVKADAINESVFVNDSSKVYGIAYEIIGNVASNYQFFLTDSSENFYRGSLYFNVSPNIDSVRPVLDFLKENIERMIQTFDWK
jgi:gliding motility-associated lipoprotein GldD